MPQLAKSLQGAASLGVKVMVVHAETPPKGVKDKAARLNWETAIETSLLGLSPYLLAYGVDLAIENCGDRAELEMLVEAVQSLGIPGIGFNLDTGHAALHGMTLEADGAFHLPNAQGHSVFSLINQDTRPFQHHSLETFGTPGITLLLDVPRVENPAMQFDLMVCVAHDLAKELQVNLVDDHRVALSDNGIARIRAQITDVDRAFAFAALHDGE